MSDQKLLSTDEAAAHIGLHPVYLRHLQRHGAGPHIAEQRGRGRGGNKYRVEDLDAWLAARQQPAEGLTTREAAEYLGLSVSALKKRHARGEVRCAWPAPKGGAGHSNRWAKADLDPHRVSDRDLRPDVPAYLSPLQRAQKEEAAGCAPAASEE